MDENILRQLLIPAGAADVRYLPQTGSTNDDAFAWAAQGAADFSLVLADEQTAGRGRLGRRWFTPPGSALAFSLIVRPTPQEAEKPSIFSPWGALAIVDTLRQKYNLTAEVKWPNDVLIRRRKTAGILVEAAWTGSVLDAVIVGIGINVAPSAVPPDDQVIFPATSLEDGLGRPIERFNFLADLLKSLLDWRAHLNTPRFTAAWQENLAFRGEWVHIEHSGNAPVNGKVIGINAEGNLLLQNGAGNVFGVSIGDVHIRPDHGIS